MFECNRDLDALPGGAELDEDALLADTGRLIHADQLHGLLNLKLEIVGETQALM